MLTKETHERINASAERFRKNMLDKLIPMDDAAAKYGYREGMKSEAERTAVLVEALERIRKWDLPGNHIQILADNALTQYNK